MASDPLLHIKDNFYFDVPKRFWRADYQDPTAMVENVGEWVVRNDGDYQDWECDRFIERLRQILGDVDALDHAKSAWKDWQHANSQRHGRPFDQYVEDSLANLDDVASKWAKSQKPAPPNPSKAFLAEMQDEQLLWMQSLRNNEEFSKQWGNARRDMDDRQELDEYLSLPRGDWSEAKTHEINHHLSGKVFIPQPFATLKNAYETKSGFGITRYMIIEVVVAVLLLLAFRWLAGKIQHGGAPRGRIWNLLESIVCFVKTDVVEKGIEPEESPRFMPLMWTLFFFILGCNLMGMLPWVGSPTASFAVTAVLALAVFCVGTYLGVQKFGFVGYLKNLCPEMGLPLVLAVFIVPMVWVIELMSLFIKHTILAVRLMINMVAGHLVLLAIMGLAFSVSSYSMSAGSWTVISVISLLGTTLLSFLELFVAFLQAYVFTLLASLFIGSATHHH